MLRTETDAATGHLPSDDLIRRLAPLAPVPGRPDLVAHQAPDVFTLWQAWEQQSGAKHDVPFWAVVWPAAQLLARFLAAHPEWARGRIVLDLGCGGGLAAIAAAKAGAKRVYANDIDPAALEMTARNAAANDVSLALDGSDLVDRGWPEDVGLILVADLFYEKGASDALLTKLRDARRGGVAVLIGDASRPFSPQAGDGVRMLAEELLETDFDLEGVKARMTRILTLEG